jgi:hypothetical protein
MGCCKSLLNSEQEVKSEEEKTRLDIDPIDPFRRRGKRTKTVIKILTRQTIKCIVGHVSDHYDVKELIGEGAYGCVRHVVHKATDQDRAMKTLMNAG